MAAAFAAELRRDQAELLAAASAYPASRVTDEEFARFVRRHQFPLLRWIRRFGRGNDGAVDRDDILQEVLIAAFEKWPELQGSEHQASWLRAVARHKIADRHRRRRGLLLVPLPDRMLRGDSSEAGTTGDGLEAVLARELSVQALHALTAGQREVLTRAMSGMTNAEIAAELDMSSAAVKKQLSRARQVAREHLEHTEDASPGDHRPVPVVYEGLTKDPVAFAVSSGLSDGEIIHHFPEVARELRLSVAGRRSPRSAFVKELKELYEHAGRPAPTKIAEAMSARSRRVPASTIASWFTSGKVPRSTEDFAAVLEFLLSSELSHRERSRWEKLRQAAAAEPRANITVSGTVPMKPPHFIASGQIRERIGEWLERPWPQPLIITGPPGIGKTALAAEFMRTQMDAGAPLAVWINASTLDSLVSGMADAAERVGVAAPNGDPVRSAHRLRKLLSGCSDPAVLVFDDATDPEYVKNLLPTNTGTKVLITSRKRALDHLGMEVAVQGFTRADSVRYMREATGLDDDAGADRVAETLGDLPLALTMAANVITTQRLNFNRFQALMADHGMHTALRRQRGHDYPVAVHESILLAVEEAETASNNPQLDETTRWLIRVLAMLSPIGLPMRLLAHDREQVFPAVDRVIRSRVAVGTEVIVMYPLTARVVRERAFEEEHGPQLVRAALQLIAPVAHGGLHAPAVEEQWLSDAIGALQANAAGLATGLDLRERMAELRAVTEHVS